MCMPKRNKVTMVMSSQCDKMKKKKKQGSLMDSARDPPAPGSQSNTSIFRSLTLFLSESDCFLFIYKEVQLQQLLPKQGATCVTLLCFAVTALTPINPNYCFRYWGQCFVALLGFKASTCWWVEAGLTITWMNITGVWLHPKLTLQFNYNH